MAKVEAVPVLTFQFTLTKEEAVGLNTLLVYGTASALDFALGIDDFQSALREALEVHLSSEESLVLGTFRRRLGFGDFEPY